MANTRRKHVRMLCRLISKPAEKFPDRAFLILLKNNLIYGFPLNEIITVPTQSPVELTDLYRIKTELGPQDLQELASTVISWDCT